MVGIEPETLAPNIDEDAIDAGNPSDPRALVRRLSVAKADAVCARIAGTPALVLACDSVFVLDGEILGKPLQQEVAVQRWRAMRGRTGTLITGHRLVDHRTGAPGAALDAVAEAAVTFADVTDREIQTYVDTGEPLNVAGAFTLEGRAAPFISRVDGDPHAVVGLSLATLRTLTRGLGVDWDALVAASAAPAPAAPL